MDTVDYRDLIGETVFHLKLGRGVISDVTDGNQPIISVKFGSRECRFPFCDALITKKALSYKSDKISGCVSDYLSSHTCELCGKQPTSLMEKLGKKVCPNCANAVGRCSRCDLESFTAEMHFISYSIKLCNNCFLKYTATQNEENLHHQYRQKIQATSSLCSSLFYKYDFELLLNPEEKRHFIQTLYKYFAQIGMLDDIYSKYTQIKLFYARQYIALSDANPLIKRTVDFDWDAFIQRYGEKSLEEKLISSDIKYLYRNSFVSLGGQPAITIYPTIGDCDEGKQLCCKMVLNFIEQNWTIFGFEESFSEIPWKAQLLQPITVMWQSNRTDWYDEYFISFSSFIWNTISFIALNVREYEQKQERKKIIRYSKKNNPVYSNKYIDPVSIIRRIFKHMDNFSVSFDSNTIDIDNACSTLDENTPPIIIDPIYVYDALYPITCSIYQHNVVQGTGYFQTKAGKLLLLPLHKCETCGKLFIGSETLKVFCDEYGDLINPILRLMDKTTFAFSSSSKLYDLGYSVRANGLTEAQRHDLLITLMESDQMTYFDICKTIETDIHNFSNHPRFDLAVAKWKADLKFIGEYVKSKESRS